AIVPGRAALGVELDYAVVTTNGARLVTKRGVTIAHREQRAFAIAQGVVGSRRIVSRDRFGIPALLLEGRCLALPSLRAACVDRENGFVVPGSFHVTPALVRGSSAFQ